MSILGIFWICSVIVPWRCRYLFRKTLFNKNKRERNEGDVSMKWLLLAFIIFAQDNKADLKMNTAII